MLSKHLAQTLPGEKRFRWRGGDVSRLETIVDAAFAFALTLLLVNTEPPRDFAALREVFVQLPVLLVTFSLLILVWHEHFIFHRRYGMEDPLTRVWNFAMLFLVLVYVFPLRFLFHILYNVLILRRELSEVTGDPNAGFGFEFQSEMQALMLLYGVGVLLIFGVFALMFQRAWSRREALGLNPVECELTRSAFRSQCISASIAAFSMAIAALNPAWSPFAGFAYCLMWPGHTWNGIRTGKAVERLEKAAAAKAAGA